MKYRYLLIQEDYSIQGTNDYALVLDALSYEMPVVDTETGETLSIYTTSEDEVTRTSVKEFSYD